MNKMNAASEQPRRNLQERLQAIIGGQVVQIAALQAQLEEIQAELAIVRQKTKDDRKTVEQQSGS